MCAAFKKDFSFDEFATFIAALGNNDLSFIVDGVPAVVHGAFSSGGTKTVYDVSINDVPYALAVPRSNKYNLFSKWAAVLDEPAITDRMRDLGFYVNDVSKLALVEVGSAALPGILMKRYQDHSFIIYDAKTSPRNRDEFFKPESKVTDAVVLSTLSPILSDISSLLKHDVRLARDSFNICFVDDEPHFYFNDLANASFEKISSDDRKSYVTSYVSNALGIVVNTLSDKSYYSNPSLRSLTDPFPPLQKKMVAMLLEH